MPIYTTQSHLIRPGENLTTISRRYGLSWKALYHHDANAAFRSRNPDPNRIRAGDRIEIPPDPVKVLGDRLKMLQKLRGECETMFNGLERELDRDFQSVRRMAAAVDTAGTVATMGVGLAKMSADGLRIAKLTGKELAAANREFLKSHLKTGTPGMQVVVEQTLGSQLDITGEEGLALGIGKVLVKSWLDMTSPSYWASRITGWVTGQTPEQAYDAARSQIRAERQKGLKNLDEKIRETERLLSEARRETTAPALAR